MLQQLDPPYGQVQEPGDDLDGLGADRHEQERYSDFRRCHGLGYYTGHKRSFALSTNIGCTSLVRVDMHLLIRAH